MADHQDSGGPAAAGHAVRLPLQHAWLPSQEDAWGLRREQRRGQEEGVGVEERREEKERKGGEDRTG